MLKIGIVGLPNVGKSTLFKALTKKSVDISNYPFCTIDPNIGVVSVPDNRLIKLSEMSKSEKIVPSAIEFVDIAGLVAGAHKGEGLGNQFLSHIREVDAICEVVRTFESKEIIHVENSPKPLRDIEIIHLELLMADLQMTDRVISGIMKETKSGNKDAIKKLELFKKIKEDLEKEIFVINMKLSKEDLFLIKDFQFLTNKPIIFVLNGNDSKIPQEIKNKFPSSEIIHLDIKFELELSDMDTADEELKKESKIDELIGAAYKKLGLITYITTGKDETRAWTITLGTAAPQAAAKIHSDFEKKFIRADVINWEKLLAVGSWAKAREQGLIRSEGKDYIVKDGDVVEFKI